ncbi:response regulator transcription factor [Pedobacter sp. SYSU D00535]|uniref:response regulator transcription factor n=1 Tax=Pedobacter sp. SYSU D00535 TaxID=2810308 RepID=UPI001A97630B|nr:response regulator transcription factor [Pedobacter sp. SYSU D00535]
MIKVFLAEDHNIVRNGIKSLIEKENEIVVVDEAVNGIEAIQKLANGVDAQILLTDLNMNGLNGLGLLEEIKRNNPQLKVLFLSMVDNEQYLLEAMRAGAAGYLLKNISRDELLFAIKHVAAGSKYICSEMSVKLLNKAAFSAPNTGSGIELSRREKEVLLLIAEGFTNNEIAEKLFTSRRTVEGHRQNLLEKTGTRNTAALIRFAVQSGLVA